MTDILTNVPASVIDAIGLWRHTRQGCTAAQCVAGLYTIMEETGQKIRDGLTHYATSGGAN
jgi:hypothetical protein